MIFTKLHQLQSWVCARFNEASSVMYVHRWLSVRLEMLGICIVFGAALFVAVLLPRNAGLAGLALTSALNLTGLDPSHLGVLLPSPLSVHKVQNSGCKCSLHSCCSSTCTLSRQSTDTHPYCLQLGSARHLLSWHEAVDAVLQHGLYRLIMLISRKPRKLSRLLRIVF